MIIFLHLLATYFYILSTLIINFVLLSLTVCIILYISDLSRGILKYFSGGKCETRTPLHRPRRRVQTLTLHSPYGSGGVIRTHERGYAPLTGVKVRGLTTWQHHYIKIPTAAID